MPMGLASRLGRLKSIMLRVWDGLQRIRLFIDNIVCFSKEGARHVCDLERYVKRLTTSDLKLAPRKAYFGVRVIKFWVTV